MKAKSILFCFLASLLTSCATYEQNESAPSFPYNPNSSSPCRAIKQQMNAIYPDVIGSRETAILKARLLREYQYYNCQG